MIGVIMGAALGPTAAAFVVGPVIKSDVLGESDVAKGWYEVGSIRDVPDGEPKVFRVDFPLSQTYGNKQIQKESGVSKESFKVLNAIWLSWHSPSGKPGDSKAPGFVRKMKKGDSLTSAQAKEATQKLNVMSNSCAHLGCPVRWLISTDGEGEFLCPCHGGLYDINGGYLGGPPPHDLYKYVKKEVRQDGRLYVKHQFSRPGQPYVI